MGTIQTRIGELSFTHDFPDGYPTQETTQKLFDEIDFQRACQAYLWGLPIVGFAQWQHAHETTLGASSCDIVFYPDYTSKLGLLTANATTPYAISFINLSDVGPVVIDMPEGEVRGGALNSWQIDITQITKPGRYVFHAPGTTPPTLEGAEVFAATTNNILFGFRLMTTDEQAQLEVLAQVRIYPLSQLSDPPEIRLVDVGDRPWQGWQPRGLEYFERLADILGREPVDERDRFYHAMLRPLGIRRGEPFAPDERQKEILTDAVLVGEAMAKANDFANDRLPQAHYHEGSHWEIATRSPWDQRWEDHEALDGRAAWFYEAVTNDPTMQSTIPGEGQIYLGAYTDGDGDWLDGANQYKLHVPPEPPAAAFWSTTVYDVSTRCLIDNEQQLADRSSRMDLLVNDDGSVDIYYGPTAPAGKEQNWIPTVPGRSWFTYFRFYSPTEPYFDRSWVLPDIEKASWGGEYSQRIRKRPTGSQLRVGRRDRQRSKQTRSQKDARAVTLPLSEQEIVDAYIYVFARYLVIRQEHIDMAEEGVDYNVLKFNELGQAEFVNPNLDVAYLETWFAVDEQTPIVLEIPRIEGRYYTAQIMDEWAEIITNINERNYPERPYGRYALCLKGSNPELPEDVLRIDLPSKKSKMLARVERQGDDEGAVELQRSFKLVKTGEPVIDPAVSIPMFTNEEPITVDVFNQPMVEQVLHSAPDAVSNAADYQRNVLVLAEYVGTSEANRTAVDDIIKDKALPQLQAFLQDGGDSRSGWTCTRQWLQFGDDILFRAAVNYAGIWWNSSAEVVYYMGMGDKDGGSLHGDHTYAIHYEPEDVPGQHVNAYWSLTLLSLPDYRVVPNELDRYNLNNISDLTYGEDGSLTLYMASTLPPGTPASNWLPSPSGQPFTLNHRLYVPKPEVLSGEWYLPPLVKVQ